MSEKVKIISEIVKSRNLKNIVAIPLSYSNQQRLSAGGWAVIEGKAPYYWESAGLNVKRIFSNIWFILSGHIVIEFNHKVYEGKPGDVLVRPSGVYEKIISYEPEFEHLYFQLRSYNELEIITRSTADGPLLKEMILYLARTKDPDKRMFQSLQKIVLENLTQEIRKKSFDSILDSFENDFTTNIRILAKNNGMSVSSFERYCKLHYSKTPAELRTKYRMEKALLLLSNTSEKLENIASFLKFSSSYAFSKAYMRYYGHRPRKDR